MSYTDLRDFEAECVHPIEDSPYVVEIEKLGGGTNGTPYSGKWRYRILMNGEIVTQGQDFHAGTALTHAEAAEEVWYLACAGSCALHIPERYHV